MKTENAVIAGLAVLAAVCIHQGKHALFPDPTPETQRMALSPNLEPTTRQLTDWESSAPLVEANLHLILSHGYSNLDYRFETRTFLATKGGVIFHCTTNNISR